ncbi:MAG: hypothetical protein QNK37_20670 [Acidobacteriota bacterium]|nr:hypothetical protein [Acidobacteriota bacterium]
MSYQIITIPDKIWNRVNVTRFAIFPPPSAFRAVNGAVSTAARSARHWVLEMQWNDLSDEDVAELSGLIFALTEPGARLKVGDRRRWQPRGTAGGAGRVGLADQTGGRLHTTGWGAGQPQLFKRGDHIEVHGALYMIRQDTASDGGGNALIPVAPRLRNSPPLNTPVITEEPKGHFLLTGEAGYERHGIHGSGSLQLEEDPYVVT